MSKQLKDLLAYPVTRNTVRVVNDQQDYALDDDENKLIVRTPDHWAIDTDSIHAHVKDGYGTILSVISLDPLSVSTSGYAGIDVDGYDGLITSADGYTRARGVIRFTTSTPQMLLGSADASIEGHYYLMGGIDLAIDGYTNAVWHSTNGFNWERFSDPPWSDRAWAEAVSDTDNIWVLGGFNHAGPLGDIWRAEINPEDGTLTWDTDPIATGVGILNHYVTASIIEGLNSAYVGGGSIDLSTGAETIFSYGQDGYDSVTHYDPLRRVFWHSDSTFAERVEYIIDDDGNHIADAYGAYGYVHRQETGATTWDIAHGLNSFEVVPVTYDDDQQLMEPYAWNVLDANTIRLEFNAAETGRCMVCLGKYYSGSTWTLEDGYVDQLSMWLAVNTDGDIIEPASLNQPNELVFNDVEDGYLLAWKPFRGVNAMGGRKYLASFVGASGNNSVTMYQTTNCALALARTNDSSMELIEPTGYDYTDETNAVLSLNGSETMLWGSFDLRHDGYRDTQEPWNMDYVTLSSNAKDRQGIYLAGSNGVWASGDAGVHWNRKDAVDAQFSTAYPTALVSEDSMVSGLDYAQQVSRSLDAGDNFTTASGGISDQSITWYGSLGISPDTTYRLFIYKRPADVVWESDFGHLPGTIIDDFNTHYVLPYPTAIDSGDTQMVIITLNVDYDRSVVANEFEDHWIYLITGATGEVVDKRLIVSNTAGAPGEAIEIHFHTLNTTPNISTHRVQVVKPRPDGAVYYSAITRNTDLRHTVYHETDGTAFILEKEQDYDWYANDLILSTLPSVINTSDNAARWEVLKAELNRQRVMNTQFFNDPFTLPPELLRRLGEQLGVALDENLDLRSQRRITSLWFSRVDAYGSCLDGVNNLIELILGANSGVTATQSDPSGDTLSGLVLNVSVSNYADYSWDFDSGVNVRKYDTAQERWGLEIDISVIPAELGTLVHRSLVHFRNNMVDGPLLITAHEFSSVSSLTNLYFDSPRLTELSMADGSSVLAVYSEPKQRRLFKFIELLKRITPFWVTIKYN